MNSTEQAAFQAETARQAPHVLMRPAIYPDGNMWCALYSVDLREGVAGFGETPELACKDFDKNWRSQRVGGNQQMTFAGVLEELKSEEQIIEHRFWTGSRWSEWEFGSTLAREFEERRITTVPPEGVTWAVERWNAEVKNRPFQNIHRAALDTTWRQVIRHFGGDPDVLVGPCHYDLVSKSGVGSEPDSTRDGVLGEAARAIECDCCTSCRCRASAS